MDMADDWGRLAGYVIARREALGMSRRELSEAIALSYRALGDIERGARQVSEGTLFRLEQGLAWQRGSAIEVLRGGEPVPADGVPAIDSLPNTWMRALTDAYRVATELAGAGQADQADRLTRALTDISQSLIAYSSTSGTRTSDFEPADQEPDGPHPTVLRIALGKYMKQLREDRQLTAGQVNNRLGRPAIDIHLVETGRAPLSKEQLSRLLTFYGVESSRMIQECINLTNESCQSGWWTRYNDILPDWFRDYLYLEQYCAVIRTYESQFIPGLLQTEDYARAIIGLPTGNGESERRVRLRMERQSILHKNDPPRLWAIIDEQAFKGSAATMPIMQKQIEHLIELNERSNVVIQILPSQRRMQMAEPSFSILRFGEKPLPDIVYLEQLTSALYIDNRRDVDKYIGLLDFLSVRARTPQESADALQSLHDEFKDFASTEHRMNRPAFAGLFAG
ncbi:Scr1 family TA system antitoxin-like transcriptional regulator [Nocardia wallacei]|uniref:Scr1 family TA system antitoxin-like transcriptional regulator n=1 Tax=Nocardia wallacei TaxID=480035 RepID=UPI00245509E2|nr:Scr1 family TA system antitoxin-like transcriptional regulator [Nocardia wallacei]